MIGASLHGSVIRFRYVTWEETRSPVGRSDFKSDKGRQTVLGGFDSHSLPPSAVRVPEFENNSG